jgi:hypothetical protein
LSVLPSGAANLGRARVPKPSIVEQLFGALRSDVPMMTPEQENAAFEEAMAQDAEPSAVWDSLESA